MATAARPQAACRGFDGDAGLAEPLLPTVRLGGRGVRTQVYDRCHPRARRLHLECDAIGAVADRGDDHPAARQYGVLFQVAQRSTREHHARTVVAREHQRLFDGPRCEHHLLRAHLPKTLACEPCGRLGEMVGDALAEAEVVMREVAEGGGARQQPDARVLSKFGDGRCDPFGRCEAVDARSIVAEQRAAESRPLVAEDHPRAAARCRERRRKARRARTDDENLAVRVLLRVAIRVR